MHASNPSRESLPRLTILIVEDNADDETLTLRGLRSTGIPIKVKVARDGEEAVRALVPSEGDAALQLPQLVLLDLNLPKIGGLDILRRVRQHPFCRNVPIVCLTSSDEERDLIQAYDAGVNGFVRKPTEFLPYIESVAATARWWLELNRQCPRHDRMGTSDFQPLAGGS